MQYISEIFQRAMIQWHTVSHPLQTLIKDLFYDLSIIQIQYIFKLKNVVVSLWMLAKTHSKLITVDALMTYDPHCLCVCSQMSF